VRPSVSAPAFALLALLAAGCGDDYTTASVSYDLTPIYSTTTPALNDTVTMAAAGFRFLPGAKVSTGGRPAVMVGISGDGSTIAFVPVPGTLTGVVSVSGIVRISQPAMSLELTAKEGITPPTGTRGTDAFATAPLIRIPDTGKSSTFLDAGPFSNVAECIADLVGPCRLYRITVGATQKIGVVATWQGNADLGIYTYDAAGTITGILTCDSKSDGPGGQPESCSSTFAPGTYYLAVVSFAVIFGVPNGDPTDFRMILTGLSHPGNSSLRSVSPLKLARWPAAAQRCGGVNGPIPPNALYSEAYAVAAAVRPSAS
jgi:hypothetical protein